MQPRAGIRSGALAEAVELAHGERCAHLGGLLDYLALQGDRVAETRETEERGVMTG